MKLSLRKLYTQLNVVLLIVTALVLSRFLFLKEKKNFSEKKASFTCKMCVDKNMQGTNKSVTMDVSDTTTPKTELREMRKERTYEAGIRQNISNMIDNTKVREKMTKRIDALQRNCRLLQAEKPYRFSIKQIPTTLSADRYHICKVPKCGSTYWTKVFLVIKKIIEFDKLSELDREEIHGPLQELIISRLYQPSLTDTMLLLTRNPWTRIYSAYVDKIYRQQETFLDQIKAMVNKYDTYCGEVPTFEQFLEYIFVQFNRGKTLDPHWRPINTLCRVCKVKYIYIMKLETFVEDSAYVIDEIIPTENYETKAELLSLLTNKFNDDNLRQIVRQFTSQFRQMNNSCLNFMDTMKRLWISLQHQGLISDDISFEAHLFRNITAVDEDKIVHFFVSKSEEKTLSKTERKLQRNRHFSHAYTTLKQKTIRAIRKVYQNDFILFGYDERLPSKLLNGERKKLL